MEKIHLTADKDAITCQLLRDLLNVIKDFMGKAESDSYSFSQAVGRAHLATRMLHEAVIYAARKNGIEFVTSVRKEEESEVSGE